MKQQASKVQRVFGATLYGGFAILFGWAFYSRFWQLRHCIAEAVSSCVMSDGANVIEGGAVWAIPAFICAVLCMRRIIQIRYSQ